MNIKEQFMKTINDKSLKTILIFSYITGILAHGMAVFNKFAFHDELGSLFGYGLWATYSSGRWATELLEYFFRWIYGGLNYSLSSYNFFISVFFTSLMSWLIIKALRIKNSIVIGLIGSLFVIFPYFTSLVGYVFTMPFCQLSFLLIVLSLYLFFENRKPIPILIGIILGSCALGIYQGIIPFMLTFVLLKLLVDSLNGNYDKIKYFFFEIVKVMLYCVAILIVYLLALKLSLTYHHAELSSYQGINTMGVASVFDYFRRIFNTYKLYFFPSHNTGTDLFPGSLKTIRIILNLFAAVFLIFVVIHKIKERKMVHIIESVFLFACFPVAYNFIYVMCDPKQTSVYVLMLYSHIFIFFLFAVLADNFVGVYPKSHDVLCVIVVSILLFSTVLYIRYDNICYTKTEFAMEGAKSYFTELKTRIESTENYSCEKKVLFLNGAPRKCDNMYQMEEFDDITIAPYTLTQQALVSNYNWSIFMMYWTGYKPDLYDGEELINDSRLQDLPHYPDAGSICVIDDVVVVNF